MIQILSCFSKTLYFDVQRFDKKLRGQSERYPLILLILNNDESNCDALINEASSPNTTAPFDTLLENPEKLENIFEDKSLYNIISNLNYKNKKMLYLLYVKQLNEVEVANELGITKQAVYKRKNNILQKIKEQYLEQ